MPSSDSPQKKARKRKASTGPQTGFFPGSKADTADAAAAAVALFPISAAEQGNETVAIHVGNGAHTQTLTMHKKLLCLASRYFDGALNDGRLLESTGGGGKLTLDNEHPFAFEFYHWLYSGAVRDDAAAFYHQHGTMTPGLFWLRVYRFADRRLVAPLREIAYGRFCRVFSAAPCPAPTKLLIDKIYEDAAAEQLQRYLVYHVAYQVGKSAVKETTGQGHWKAALDHHDGFKAAVGARMVDLRLSGESMHPSTLKEFEGYKAARSIGMGIKTEPSPGVGGSAPAGGMAE